MTESPHAHLGRNLFDSNNIRPYLLNIWPQTGYDVGMVYCYLNGKVLPLEEANLSVYDLGVLRGFGVYEALVARGGTPFRLVDHLARFRRTATQLNLSVPVSDAEITAVLSELIERNGYKDTTFRFILTGGEAIGGIEYNPATPTFYILAEEFKPLPERYGSEGCSLITFEHMRQLPELKTTNYLQAVVLQQKRKEAGALEILYTHEGRVLEASTSSFFIVSGGKIITPQEGILEGITRKVVLELARPQFAIEERDITSEEMYAADEAFITSTFKDIVPVVKVDQKTIGTGVPGPVTKELMRLFHDYAHSK